MVFVLLAFVGSSLSTAKIKSAQALAKKNECTKCHAVDKEKKGPSYKKIAAKYKGKADGEEKEDVDESAIENGGSEASQQRVVEMVDAPQDEGPGQDATRPARRRRPSADVRCASR